MSGEMGQVRKRSDIDTRLSTQSEFTLARDELGAGAVASGAVGSSLSQALRQDSSKRGGPAGADDASNMPRYSN